MLDFSRRIEDIGGVRRCHANLRESAISTIKPLSCNACKASLAVELCSLICCLLLASPAASAEPPLQAGIVPFLTSDALSAATTTVLTLFLLAVLLESALAILFNWRPFIESFNARATRPLVSFGVALAFVVYFNFDAVTGLMNAVEKPQPQLLANWFGCLLTAAILAGGSAGVNTMLVALGFRELKTPEMTAPKLDLTQAWVAIRVVQERSIGEVRVQIGEPTSKDPPYVDLPLAGVISGVVNKPLGPIRHFFLRDPSRFPPSEGTLSRQRKPAGSWSAACRSSTRPKRAFSRCQ